MSATRTSDQSLQDEQEAEALVAVRAGLRGPAAVRVVKRCRVERPVAARVGGMATMGEALIMACFHGEPREVRRLLSGGADVDAVGEQIGADKMGGITPLMAASDHSHKGHVIVVDILLAAQANVHVADDVGGTALTLS